MTIRQDSFKVNQARIDQNGILRISGTIARIGVQEYVNSDGTITRELRPEQEVLDSAPSFSNQPITLDHPKSLVDSENAKEFSKGLSGDTVEYLNGLLEAKLVITHKDAVEAAQTSHRQISCGYTCDLADESGEWVDTFGVQGEPGKVYKYDRVQKNIRGNHVALVRKARAGDVAKLHFDSEECAASVRFDSDDDLLLLEQSSKDKPMKFLYNDRLLTLDGDDAETVLETLNKIQSENIELTQKIQNLDSAIAESNAAKAELEGKIAALESQATETKSDSIDVAAEIQARLEAWDAVKSHVKCDADYSLDVLGIRKVYLKSIKPELAEKIDSADASFINGMYSVLAPTEVKEEQKADSLEFVVSKALPEVKNDAAMTLAARRKANFAKKGKK